MLYRSCAPTVRSAHSFAGGCMLARSTLCRLVMCLAAVPAAAAAQADKIPWVKGPTKGVLEVTENPVSGNERGVVLCQSDANPAPWFVLFSYDQSGYVRDDEGSNL